MSGTLSDRTGLAGTHQQRIIAVNNTMKTQILMRVSGKIMVAVAVTLAMLITLVYALQNPHIALMLATVSWNG